MPAPRRAVSLEKVLTLVHVMRPFVPLCFVAVTWACAPANPTAGGSTAHAPSPVAEDASPPVRAADDRTIATGDAQFECSLGPRLTQPSSALLRAIAPMSGSLVPTRPTFRALVPSGAGKVQLCSDRICKRVVAEFPIRKGRARPSRDLPVGVTYWRIIAGKAKSPIWVAHVLKGAVSGWIPDVNGDGHLDVTLGGLPVVYVGEAGGSRHAVPLGDTESGEWLPLELVGDTNGDGYTDAVLVVEGEARLHLGGPRGLERRSVRSLETNEEAPSAWFGGDLNQDGYADVLVESSGRIQMHPGAPTGARRKPIWTVDGTDLVSVSPVGDVDGDGHDDIVVGRGEYHRLEAAWFLGGPDGPGCAPKRVLKYSPGLRFGSWAGAAGDLDGDGASDLMVASPSACDCCQDCSDSPDEMTIYRGGTDGPRDPPWLVLKGANGIQNRIEAVGGLDMRGDGRADLLIVHGESVYLYEGGQNKLGPPVEVLSLPDARDLSVMAAGDLNRDGLGDAIVISVEPEHMRAILGGAKVATKRISFPELP